MAAHSTDRLDISTYVHTYVHTHTSCQACNAVTLVWGSRAQAIMPIRQRRNVNRFVQLTAFRFVFQLLSDVRMPAVTELILLLIFPVAC